MIKRSQDQTEGHDKIIYKAETTTGWSVVVMPGGILIDNYHHGYTHIHPNPYKHKIKERINENTQQTIFMIVYKHIEENEEINLKTLIKELKK